MFAFRITAAQFILFTALALAPNVCAQGSKCISVRILNAKNGKPIRGVRVDLAERLGDRWHYELPTSLGKTDSTGTLQYCPPHPAPKAFALNLYQFGSGWDGPAASYQFDLAQVLKHGMVGYYETPPTGFTARATPGEILVFGRRWKLIQRILPEPEWP